MIIEILQIVDFIRSGTVRLLFIFFLVHITFLLAAKYYSLKYKPFTVKENPLSRHKVSIIISVWREKPELLKMSIDSALNSGAHEVIVAYSVNDLDAQKVVNSYGNEITRVVFESRVPKRLAIYEGIKRASGDIVVILDSDTIIGKDSLAEICKPFDVDPKVGGVVSNVMILNKDHFVGKLSNIIERSRTFVNKAFTVLGNVHVLDSRLCAYRKEAVIPVLNKYLNEKFLGRNVIIGEDKMMTYLLQKNGWKCVMQETAISYTAAPDNLKKLLKQQLRWARSGYMYFFRHRHCLKLNWLLTFHILLYFLSPVIFPFVVYYDVFMAPPIINLGFLQSIAIIVVGTSLIVLVRKRTMGASLIVLVRKRTVANFEISLIELPLIGLFGLLIMMPLFIYALITMWRIDSWVTR